MLTRDSREHCGRVILSLIHKSRILLLSLLITWGVLCSVSLLTGVLNRFVDPPRDLPLLWPDFDDFVEGANGDVYVHIASYSRVFRYDRMGRFIASYPAPGETAELAAGSNGLLYLRAQRSVYTYDEGWNRLSSSTEVDCSDRTWRQGGDGQPLCTTTSGAVMSTRDRAVTPGELLYTAAKPLPRARFNSFDGTALERRGNSLLRLSKDGEVVVRYDSPWFLPWGNLPWPFSLGCAAYFFLLLNLAGSKHTRGMNPTVVPRTPLS